MTSNRMLLSYVAVALVTLSVPRTKVTAFSSLRVSSRCTTKYLKPEQIRGNIIFQSSFTETEKNEVQEEVGQTIDKAPMPSELLFSSVVVERIQKMIGTVDDSRIIFPEYNSGEVPRMFSALDYGKDYQGKTVALHAEGSVVGATALIIGTTVGAGILALPSATAAAGFLPSTAAMIAAYVYMTMSGLLIAELMLNRIGETGRPGVGLLELYESSLGKPWSGAGSIAYMFLHYAMLVAYISQGGVNVDQALSALGLHDIASVPGFGQVFFAAVVGLSLFVARPALIESLNNIMVVGVAMTFAAIIAIGASTADFSSLVDHPNQHPEVVISCFPILFLSLVYQNVVPTVVTQLEGDRRKITTAILLGTSIPMVMFLAWNAVVLGNVAGVDLTSIDPVRLLQSGTSGEMAALAPLLSTFSLLAVTTSIVGFTHGLVSAWTDLLNLNSKTDDYRQWKAPIFSLVFLPPLALSMADPDIFYQALDYGGAFGVSTLFLILPPLMVWNERYRKDNSLVTKPLVPFGKIPLGSMWKAAGTLIIEQGAEKLGVLDFLQKHYFN